MARSEFIKMVIRAGLLLILVLVSVVLGKRVVSGNDCSGCPGSGVCKGISDCDSYKEF
jgi:hypothetical protein